MIEIKTEESNNWKTRNRFSNPSGMRRDGKWKWIFLLLLIAVIGIPTLSNAFNHYRHGYYHSVVHVNAQIVKNAKYRTPYLNAMSVWNGSTNRIRWGNANASESYVRLSGWNEDFYGRYAPLGYKSNGRASKFKIEINDNRLFMASSIFRQSVIAHEMGHALCLDHNTSSTSLMNSNRNRNSIYKPNQDDIRGVNYAY